MAKNDKDLSFEAQKAQEAKEARKKLKAAEKAKPEKEKEKKAATGKKKGKKFLRWFRDFRGETKKIVWPDFKTVMKGTGIVIMTVIIIGSMVWIVDWMLTNAIAFARTAAQGSVTEQIEESGEPNFDDLLGGLLDNVTSDEAEEPEDEAGEEATEPEEETTEE